MYDENYGNTYENNKDVCDGYGFRFLDTVKTPVIELTALGREKRYGGQYYWDNRRRPPAFLFQYTLGGSGTVKIQDQTYSVDEGSAFFLQMPGEERYYFDEASNRAPWEFVYIMMEGAGVLPYFEYVEGRLGKIMRLSDSHPAVKELLNLHTKAKNGLLANAFAASSGAFLFLCLLCDISAGSEKQQPDIIRNAKAYVENNYAKAITLAQAAEYAGVSQSHLSREFLKYTGENLIQYLTKVRLEKAAALLNETSWSLEQICACCGFSSGNYFGKVFKKYMKISPGEFRKRMRTQEYTSVRV